jgi:hypothetical protein
MASPHPDGTFTLLPSGRVLALGGRSGDRTGAEVFDPALELWTPASPMPRGRASHAAVVLPSGDVLVAGGESEDAGVVTCLSSADVYDPVNDAWTSGGDLLHARASFTMIASPAGDILVIGGHDGAGDPAPVERYCP